MKIQIKNILIFFIFFIFFINIGISQNIFLDKYFYNYEFDDYVMITIRYLTKYDGLNLKMYLIDQERNYKLLLDKKINKKEIFFKLDLNDIEKTGKYEIFVIIGDYFLTIKKYFFFYKNEENKRTKRLL